MTQSDKLRHSLSAPSTAGESVAPPPDDRVGAARSDPLKQLRHDLRTSVVHILGYSELLEEDATERGLGDFISDLRKIQVSGKHLLDLIGELRMETAEEAHRLDLDRLHYEFRTALSQVSGFAEILVELAEDGGHTEMLSDLGRIREAAGLLLGRSGGSLDVAIREAFEHADGGAVRPAQKTPQETGYTGAADALSASSDGGRLLVIDDDEGNRDLLKRRLKALGFEVLLAENGEQGLARAEAAELDLILLDILMPGLDGYEVLRRLKRDKALRHVPVIMLSALDEVDSVVQCLLMGADDYLAKPFNPVLLRTRIGACLEKHRLRRRLARKLRIFVSSPGDVDEERQVVQRVIQDLALEFGGQVSLEPFFWEAEPLLATETFQSQIVRPADCQIFICILWSRLGTRLPPNITRSDGSRYDSGTQYEFESAVEGFRRSGYPKILVYRKTAELTVSLTDREELLYRLGQKEALDRFVRQWFQAPEEEGFVAAFHGFEHPGELRERMAIHLRKLIVNELKTAG